MLDRYIYSLLLLTSASAGFAQEAPMTRESAAQVVANTCPYGVYNRSNSDWIANNRKRFVVNDRLTTRDNEIWINKLIADQDKCLLNTQNHIEQAAMLPEAERRTLRTAIIERQEQAPEGIRAMFVAAGYKPSSAPPGPRFGYCIIHDSFGEQQGFLDHRYVSRVFIDRDPENEIPETGRQFDPNKTSPKTMEGQKVLGSLSRWAAERYIRAESRDAFCSFFMSAQEAEDLRPKEESIYDPAYFQVPIP